MTTTPITTNAASSDVTIDKKTLKQLMRRSDRRGLSYLATCVGLLAGAGSLLQVSLWSWWAVPAMLLYGGILATVTYALSHECAHGTAFRSRRLNETLFWITSLIYGEEPYHRRYSHACHHSHTWIRGVDSQMPFETPLTLPGWLLEVSGLGIFLYEVRLLLRHAAGRFDREVRDYTPQSELPRLKWGARAFLAIYGGGAAAIVLSGAAWPLAYLVIPRVAGGVVMQLFTIIQHAEMAENSPDLTSSTRSFRSNRFANLIYWNMSYHLEHHMFPTVPFHALPRLNAVIRDQLPAPDTGLLATNWQVLRAVLRRGLRTPRVVDAT